MQLHLVWVNSVETVQSHTLIPPGILLFPQPHYIIVPVPPARRCRPQQCAPLARRRAPHRRGCHVARLRPRRSNANCIQFCIQSQNAAYFTALIKISILGDLCNTSRSSSGSRILPSDFSPSSSRAWVPSLPDAASLLFLSRLHLESPA